MYLKLFALLLTFLVLLSVQVFEGDELLQLNFVLSRRFLSLNMAKGSYDLIARGTYGCLVDELVIKKVDLRQMSDGEDVVVRLGGNGISAKAQGAETFESAQVTNLAKIVRFTPTLFRPYSRCSRRRLGYFQWRRRSTCSTHPCSQSRRFDYCTGTDPSSPSTNPDLRCV